MTNEIWSMTARDPQMVCHQKKFGNRCCMNVWFLLFTM